jgi:hypothetical protein
MFIRSLFFIILFMFNSCSLIVGEYWGGGPPKEQIENAQLAMDSALLVQADKYAKEYYDNGIMLWKEGIEQVKISKWDKAQHYYENATKQFKIAILVTPYNKEIVNQVIDSINVAQSKLQDEPLKSMDIIRRTYKNIDDLKRK